MCLSAGIGAVLGGAIEGGIYAFTTDDFTLTGLAEATARGAVIGGIGGALMPGAGNAVARAAGLSGAARVGTSAAVNAAVGAGYAWAVNTALCRPTNPTDLLLGALGGAASGLVGPATTRGSTPTFGPGAGAGRAESVTRAGRTDQSSVITGHGYYVRGSGDFQVPQGTWLYFYTQDGRRLSDSIGLAVETGQGIRPVEIFVPGSMVPDYTVAPPSGLNISGQSISVTEPTRLSNIVRPNMGPCHAAICREHTNPGN